MLSFWLIPPGVLHLYCVIIVVNDWRVEDDDDDMATEVQTNFYHSQYYTMITTKSKIKIIIIHIMISYILNEYIPCCFPSFWSLILLLLLYCNLSNVSSVFPMRAMVKIIFDTMYVWYLYQKLKKITEIKKKYMK